MLRCLLKLALYWLGQTINLLGRWNYEDACNIAESSGTKLWIHCSIQLLVNTKNVCSFASLHKNWMNLLAKQIVQCSKSASLLPSRGNSGEWHLSWVRKSGWFQWNINDCWWQWYLQVHCKTSKCQYFVVTCRLVSRVMAKGIINVIYVTFVGTGFIV